MNRFVLLVVTTIISLNSYGAVLLDDTWADGTRSNQNPPTDSAWFTSSAANMKAFTGFLSVTNTGSSSTWTTYFTAPGDPAHLNVGDTLVVTLSFIPKGIAPTSNSSQNWRVGLYDSSAGARVASDSSPTATGYVGYALLGNFGPVWGRSTGLDLRKRTTTSSSGILTSTSDYTSLGSGGTVLNSTAFSNDVPYTLTFAITRDTSTTISWTASWSGGGLTNALTVADASNITTDFDTFIIRPSDSVSTATNFNFTEFKVNLISAGSPPSFNSQPQDQAVFTNQSATFTVDADGTAPLSYQWFYNTNTLLGDGTNASFTITSVQPSDAGTYQVVVTNSFGSITSSVAMLTINVPVAPSISTQPQNQTVLPGGNAQFSVIASGTGPLSYQWYFNNTSSPVSNGTDSILTLTSVQIAAAGSYFVVVSNFVGSVTSSNAVLTVNTNPVAPVFITQPASIVVLIGGTASFTATAAGTAPITYHWNKGGVPIPGANSTTLNLVNVQTTNSGSYTLTASNSVGSTTSDTAVLIATPGLPVVNTAYNLTGFGQAATGGGVLPDTDPKYAKVFTATDLANALNSKTVKIIEIMNDLNLGFNEIEPAAKAGSEPFRAHNPPKLHPVLLSTGVSLIDIQKKSGLTIFSANGATIRHACFNVKSSGNVIIRNLKFDELWEWDEASKGNYDGNDWDFIDLGNAGTVTNIWIDHCTFSKTYDGIVDIKGGSFNITISWCKYTGDDGATNTNSWVRQQINALETARTNNTATNKMYNFLRANGFSIEDLVTILQGHDKTHLIGANDLDPENAQHSVTFHHDWFMNPWDRLPRLRAGNVHNYNIYVDDTLGLAARRLRDARAAAMSTANRNTLNNTYNFKPFLNGTISTESGAILVEKSVYIDCLTPLRNNQTDPSNPVYTGKVKALDTIYQMDSTIVRGNSTDPGNPLGPFQAAIIPFSWNLPGNQLPYSYTMDDPSQLQSIVTSSNAGAGAGVLTWAKTNWLITAYPATAPSIVADPQSQTVDAGQSATFIVVAGGSAPLAYRWYFNTNSFLATATNTALALNNVQTNNAGSYFVIVSNTAGTATSAVVSLTVILPLSGFDQWRLAHFTADQLTNSAISGAAATPANDGVPNFVKYSLGLLPFTPASQPLVGFRVENGEGILSYHRPSTTTDVTYTVEVSTDLGSWTQTGVTQTLVGTDVDGLQIWEANYSGPGSSQRFFRLLVGY